MAENKAAGKEKGEDGAAAESGGNKKKILIAAAAGVAVLVLGIVLGVVLLGGKDEEAEDEAKTEEVHAPPALYVALGEKFTVTLPGEGKPHYLQVAVSALTRDQAVAEELQFNAPLLRDRLNSLFARQEFDKLRTEEGKLALRAEVLATVQGIVGTALAESAAAAQKDGDDEEEEDEKPRKKGKKKQHEEQAPAPGVEQVFFTEFVLQ